jgi:poly(ADP-ribose) glycohydrolase ARH3
MSSVALLERFHGCLLGLAVGDALGGRFEGQSPDWIAGRFPTLEVLLADAPADTIHYTDDTQMAIGVAETLIENLDILEDRLRHHFVANYVPSRGYGRGARCVLEAMQEGQDYKEVAATHFPGGSLGNGAAMRVAPVGLFFHDDLDQVWERARLSALPTHIHPLGIEGAQLLAVAVALCLRQAPFDRTAFFGELLRRCQSDDYRERLGWAATAQAPDDLARIGNGIKALESVPTAIALFASAPESYSEVIGRAILLGGDTDTIAAMSGALSGAYLGADAIPAGLLSRLEDDVKGRTYLAYLAEQLHQSHETRAGV